MLLAIPLAGQEYVRERIPPLLTWDELREIGEKEPMPVPLKAKVDRIKTTAFFGNDAWFKGVRPVKPPVPRLGPSLRALFWNIERGINFDLIAQMWLDKRKFIAGADLRNAAEGADLGDQIDDLRKADLLILNELDWGMKRTKYREVARELGEALGMNWAYAVEFFEVDPVNLGTEKFADTEAEESAKLREMLVVDKEKFRGMHGSAILSRYPIRSATAEPFESQPYDWYKNEIAKVSSPEKGRRLASEKIFLETILREIRRGGRTMLTVVLDVPDLPGGSVTVVAPHIENHCKPEKRREQMKELLAKIKEVKGPIIIGGDMNTSMSDATPTTVKREIFKRVGSAQFWAVRGLKWATGLGLAYDIAASGFNTVKNLHDPTAKHIPIVAPNPEAEMFDDLEKFLFADGGRFDFRGDPLIARGRAGTLANSNERAEKGFVSTYALARTIGPIGQFKLDWFFIKPGVPGDYRFAPHFPRTYKELNNCYPERLSDHYPMTVELPFTEPGKK